MTSTRIDKIWTRIEIWASTNAACMVENLKSGAADDEIAGLEKDVGRQLPADFRESLLRHNGEQPGWPCTIFADYGDFLSIEEIIGRRKLFLEIANQFAHDEDQIDVSQLIENGIIFVEGPVKPVLFSPEWIPILDFNGDIFWALDFDPAEDGHGGQVIEVDWEGISWRVVAQSFTDFLTQYLVRLESGEYRIVDGHPTRHDT